MAATPIGQNGVVPAVVDPVCSCAEESSLTRSQSFDIAPAGGGGWDAWSQALARLLTRLAVQPAHCVVITQEPNQRYVQLIVGHGHAHIQASSNHYLDEDFRLDPSETDCLARLGFEPPDMLDDEWRGPRNWWIDEESIDPIDVAGLIFRVLSTVMTFHPRWPIHIEIFGADSPCAACFWEEAS